MSGYTVYVGVDPPGRKNGPEISQYGLKNFDRWEDAKLYLESIVFAAIETEAGGEDE